MSTTEKPIPASWPQQKALWSISRKVAEGPFSKYPFCDFDTIRRLADGGELTRAKAHEIINAFYEKNFHVFRGGIWSLSGSKEVDEMKAFYDADHKKFDEAIRRPKTHKDMKFTYKEKEEEKGEEEQDKQQPQAKQDDGYGGMPPFNPDFSKKKKKDSTSGGNHWEDEPFKVGDRVIYAGDRKNDPYPWMRGNTGIIVSLVGDSRAGVCYDNPFKGGHNGHSCNGASPNPDRGWFQGTYLLMKYADAPTDTAEDSADYPIPGEKGAKPDQEDKKKEEKKKQEKFDVVTPDYEKPSIFDDVCLMIKNGVQVLLVGPSGCGKSMMINEIHKVLERELYVESFAGGKRYAQVFGSTHLINGESKWSAADFLKAVQRPGIVFMDEVMSADADVLIGCNSILDRKTRCFHTPEGVVEVHPECVIVGASNVSGREYSQNYKGTQQQDASILNRFVHVPMTYDKKVEQKIVSKSGIPEEDGKNLLVWLNELRTKISINNIMYDPSTRKLVQSIELIKMGMTAKKAFTYAFLTPMSEIEKKKVGDIC